MSNPLLHTTFARVPFGIATFALLVTSLALATPCAIKLALVTNSTPGPKYAIE